MIQLICDYCCRRLNEPGDWFSVRIIAKYQGDGDPKGDRDWWSDSHLCDYCMTKYGADAIAAALPKFVVGARAPRSDGGVADVLSLVDNRAQASSQRQEPKPSPAPAPDVDDEPIPF